MNFAIRAIGHQYPSSLPSEGVFVVFQPSGIEIVFAMSNPDPYEISAFKSGHPTKIGLCKFDRLAALIIDFGHGFNLDVPFDAGLEKTENIPVFDGWNDGSQIEFTFIGVDTARLNRIFGMRTITASSRVSNLVVSKIQEQVAHPIESQIHASKMTQFYTRYPTFNSLKTVALAFDSAGKSTCDKSVNLKSKAKSHGWPANWGSPEVLPCAKKMLNRNGVHLSTFLQRIIAGDYGLSDKADGWIDELRNMGQRFSALFEMKDNTLLYISVNEFGRTIVVDWNNR